ncbi:MAG: hypothetical protein Q9174_003101, partial [Haloplaca sp. 1 TL-2023]
MTGPRPLTIDEPKIANTKVRHVRPGKRPVLRRWARKGSFEVIKMMGFFAATLALRTMIPRYGQEDYTWPMHFDPVEHVWVGDESISRLPRKILNRYAVALTLPFAPIIVLATMQIFVNNIWDFNAALSGLLASADITSFTTLFIRILWIYPRPTFLKHCKPRPSEWNLPFHPPSIVGQGPVLFNLSSCDHHPRHMSDQLDAIPSSSIVSAFTVATFISIYVNAKVKGFSHLYTPLWKTLLVVSPIWAAMALSIARIMENNTTPTIAAFSAFL